MVLPQITPQPVAPAEPEEPAAEEGAVVSALLELLAATVLLYLETHVAHWNIEGPSFFSIHAELGKQYEQLIVDADRIAERVRALGQAIEIGSDEPLSIPGETDAVSLVEALAAKRQLAVEKCKEVYRLAEPREDIATSMLMEELAIAHEKVGWMYRAFLGTSA